MNPDHLIPLRVAARRDVANDVVELRLVSTDGSALPGWEPGAHIDLVLPDGTERQYSLCGARDAAAWTVAVLREPAGRGGSAYVHDGLAVGAAVAARVPRHHFVFDADRPALFVAGGIGITPLLSMIAAAEEAGLSWSLVYAGRRRTAMAYLAELEERYGDRVAAYPATERRLELAAVLDEARAAGRTIYCCGPARLIEAVEQLSADAPAGSVRFERFVPKAVAAHEEVAFEVEVGGQLLTVPPDRSILEVCEEAGMLVLSSCREGTCGTCETPLLEGEADHRDSVLTPQEQADNRTLMICVSRAISPRLVLDL
ncbi:PDR/VanB family oxidoreductase [Nocardioides sp. BP30]|uniref:PDR/VanB family oxidoreductase n=1 Tax=Nocardioides sp. BP30 TaxID=3036374 RepID=UPI002468F9F7|nr:PDR/VanB family oxidoreductase [Nocardioides sp. BP30]WGL52614.1 PDR/VanB family oxidoreductase [Nocardioides sp. BP30]